jgi:hypothetical protein
MSAQAFSLLLGVGSAVGSFTQGQAASSAAKVTEKSADLRATQALQAYRIAALRDQGAARASYARAGVDPNRGSPADVVAEMTYWQEMDAQRAYFNEKNVASAARRAGQAARLEGTLGATSTFLDVAARGLTTTQKAGTDAPPLFEFNDPTDLPGTVWQRTT